MARGRFISSAIITDRQIHDLSSDTCRLAYTWMISLADRDGRVVGEPDLLLAQLFPRRLNEISPDEIEGFIREWVQAGFVIWYEGKDGDRVLQLVNFEKHQVGLRKERETASAFDKPEDCRIIDGVVPDKIPFKLNDNINDNDKVKSNENDAKSDFSEFQKVWEQETGKPIAGFTQFYRMCEDFVKVGVTPELYRTAIQEQSKSSYAVSNPTSVKSWAIGLLKKKDTQPAELYNKEQLLKEIFND